MNGIVPYKRTPKNTEFKKKPVRELVKDVDWPWDHDEIQSLFYSQGIQIAWNIGKHYGKYWITTGNFRASCTLHDLSLFLILNKFTISETDVFEFAGYKHRPSYFNLHEFFVEFVANVDISRLEAYTNKES
ncbi:hypothetical protein [Mangrovibacterium lignilyticum]|uniref:hypothetical protein n=1 Tax=Mangrovibacterium lignilyticum TaxID=2668052 RepID=UPI0013D35DBD|nr:hypothetical protein [Mangrovibacterium lignilyticum]